MSSAMDLLPWTFSNVDVNQPAMKEAKEYRKENSETRDKLLEEFMNMLLEEDLPFQPFLNTNFLMRFLRGAKFRCSVAYKRLERHYAIRGRHPDIFRTYLPSSTLQAQSLNIISALPYRARDNSVVVINKLRKFDPTITSFDEFVRLVYLIIESLLQNPVTQLCGITALFDFTDFSHVQMSEFSPERMKTLFDLFHSSNTMLVKNVHVVNAPGMASSLFNLLQPLMTDKVRSRFHMHTDEDWEALHSLIPSEILPEEYGGQITASELVDLYELINCNEDYFRSQMDLNCNQNE